MMRDAILKFQDQFSCVPVVVNGDRLTGHMSFLLTGMGGSHLNADLLLAVDPLCDLTTHRDYGLPVVSEEKKKKSLFIASSYSGNTEEVLYAYNEAKEQGLDMAAVAVGGRLIEMAKADGIPYVQLPDTGIQPRSALGFSFQGLLALMGRQDVLNDMRLLAERIDPALLEADGIMLAERMKDHVPVIYSSRRNETLAWNWKIKMNETGKIPAFYNVFPELNHNEMTGFDVTEQSKHLSSPFHVVLLGDDEDHEKNQTRMNVVATLYEARGLPVTRIQLKGASRLEKLFRSLLIADWTAVHTAELYGLESEQVPMVEEFKHSIA